MQRDFEHIGIRPPQVLLPVAEVDMKKWAVVACDQFTSQMQYWQDVQHCVGDAPSTLRMIIPEAYLNRPDVDEMQREAACKMEEYLQAGLLHEAGCAFIFVERSVGESKRYGLMAELDLEAYDFRGKALVRPTEKTVLERLPPRMAVRQMAPIELPHVLVLFDDEHDQVFAAARSAINFEEPLYDFDLMSGGGHIRAWHVRASGEAGIAQAFEELRVGSEMLFAVGDGNHSLATAKMCWEQIKQTLAPEAWAGHPARYALVELENLRDEGIVFHPIHRVIFGVNADEFIQTLAGYMQPVQSGGAKRFVRCVSQYGSTALYIPDEYPQSPVCMVQDALERTMQDFPQAYVDYVHGEDACIELGAQADNVGILLDAFDKEKLFSTVLQRGVLPQKSFSMGEAWEKRYYIECRRIKAEVLKDGN